MKKILLALTFIILLFGCESEEPFVVEGYRPVYSSYESVQAIFSSEPLILKDPGKIYIKGNTIFICERGKGVHVIDNSDPENPLRVSFINIVGVKDVAVSGDILYADNISDLVAINISDPLSVELVKRVEDVYPRTYELYPEYTNCYFECVDTTKGYVVDWIKTELTDPKCER